MSTTQVPLSPVAIAMRLGSPTVDQILQARASAPAAGLQTPGLQVVRSDTPADLVIALSPGVRRPLSYFNY